MSALNLINKDNIRTEGAAKPKAPGFTDVFFAARQEQLDISNVDSRDRLIGEERSKRDKLYKELVGRNLLDDIRRSRLFDSGLLDFVNSPLAPAHMPAKLFGQKIHKEELERIETLKDEVILRLKETGDSAFNELQSEEEILNAARERAKQSSLKFEEVSSKAGGVKGFFGSLAGAMAGSLQDPLNIITMIPQAGMGYKSVQAAAQVAKPLLNRMAESFMENAAQEGAAFKEVKAWREEIGQTYSAWDLVANMFTSGLLGAAFTGTLEIPSVFKKKVKALRGDLENSRKNMTKKESRAAAVVEREIHLNEAIPDKVNKVEHQNSADTAMKAVTEDRALEFDELPVKESEVYLGTDVMKGNVIDDTIRSRKIKQSEIPAIVESAQKGELWRAVIELEDGKVKVTDINAVKGNAVILAREQGKLLSMEPVTDIPKLVDGKIELIPGKKGENTATQKFITDEMDIMKTELEAGKAEWVEGLKNKDPENILAAMEKGKGNTFKKIETIAQDRLEKGYLQDGIDVEPHLDYAKSRDQDTKTEYFFDKDIPDEALDADSLQEQFLEAAGFKKEATLQAQEQKSLYDGYNAPERIGAEETSFNDLLEQNPDFEVEEGITIKQISEEFKNDEVKLKAIQTCIIGKK